MGPQGAPEELRFDFAELADEAVARGRPARRRGDGGEDPASELRRRVEEVSAVAHARRPRGGATQAMLVTELLEGTPAAGRPGSPVRATPLAGDGADAAPAGRSVAAERGGDMDRWEVEGDAEEPDAEEPDGEGAVADGRSSDGSLTIAAFYDRLRQAIARSFPGEWWVTGEIRGLRESRGHRYLELADEGATDPRGRAAAQQLEVVCWSRDWPPVAAALAEAGVDLEVGRVVRVRGRVSVWEGGSKLRFSLSAIDVDALLGGIAAARHRLLKALAAENLLEANARLGCPLVPLRIGVVTSPGSEAHRDFVGELKRSGYAFEVLLEPSLVQGAEAPVQLAAALGRLARRDPDLAVVVRGGGARGDLAAFDREEVARAIATAPFPVWTGVGHTGDRSVADEVAQRACITPTACGQAVVALVDDYVGRVTDLSGRLASLARARLEGAAARLETRRTAVARSACHQLDRRRDLLWATAVRLGRSSDARLTSAARRLVAAADRLPGGAGRALAREERELHRRQQVLRAYDPRRQLDRGWSLTRDGDGRLVRSCADAAPGTELHTRLSDGELRSVVVQHADRQAAAGTPAGEAGQHAIEQGEDRG